MDKKKIAFKVMHTLKRPEVQVALVAALILAKKLLPARIEPIEDEPGM